MGDLLLDGPEVRTRCRLRPSIVTPTIYGPGARRGTRCGRVAGFTEDGRLINQQCLRNSHVDWNLSHQMVYVRYII